MGNYTPGPWSAVGYYSDSVSVVDTGGFTHVDVKHCAVLLDYESKLGIPHWADSELASRDISDEEQEANALLIAAAPELLEALIRLFGADMEYCMEMDGKDDQLEAIRLAKAAISKAQGE